MSPLQRYFFFVFFLLAIIDGLVTFAYSKEAKNMNRTTILDAYDPQCPIRNILARMSDKWSLLVIYTLTQAEKMRFGDLRRAIPDISQKNAYHDVEDIGRRRIYHPNDLSGGASPGRIPTYGTGAFPAPPHSVVDHVGEREYDGHYR